MTLKNKRYRVTQVSSVEYETDEVRVWAELVGPNPNLPSITVELHPGPDAPSPGDEVELDMMIVAELTDASSPVQDAATKRVPRERIRWWASWAGSLRVVHHAVMLPNGAASLCGADLPKDAEWSDDGVTEQKCCRQCLSMIDYGEALASSGL